MKEVTGKCLWIAFKIWLFAVVFNSIGGALLVSTEHSNVTGVGMLICLFSAMYSFPIFILLFILLKIMIENQHSFNTVFLTVLLTGIFSSCVAALVFFNDITPETFRFGGVAVLSGTVSIFTQYGCIKEVISERDVHKEFLEESNQ